jgi:hypothetical protein
MCCETRSSTQRSGQSIRHHRAEWTGHSLRATRNISSSTGHHARARLVKKSLPEVLCSVVQGESLVYCQKLHADPFQDNPEDTTEWSELYLKVFENDCPAFAANGLLRPNFHRPKPKKPSATVTSESLARSRHQKGACRHAFKMLQTKNPSATSIGPQIRPPNLADETWLQARGWTMDNEGFWSNADPLFRCQRCESAGRICRIKRTGFVALLEDFGGGLSLGSCSECSHSHVPCSVASKVFATRYYWVQAEHGGGFQWESAGRDDSRRRVFEQVPPRGVSHKILDSGPHGDDADKIPGDMVRCLIGVILSADGAHVEPSE